MIGPRNSVPRKQAGSVASSSGGGGAAANDQQRKAILLSKLLARVSAELKGRGITPTADIMEQAKQELSRRWSEHGLSDREIRDLVTALRIRSRSSLGVRNDGDANGGGDSTGGPTTTATAQQRTSFNDVRATAYTPDLAAPPSAPISEAGGSNSQHPSSIREVLKSTTRRQRQLLADQEWIRAAEDDRVAGTVGRIKDKENHNKSLARQRGALDTQIEEHEREKAAERERQRQAQKDMDDAVAEAKRAAQQERQEAFDKALKEKRFREAQKLEMDRQKEEQRIAEHNEQVRHTMMVRQELQEARENERKRKLDAKSEWERVLQENQAELQHKQQAKQRERDLDRKFQEDYIASLDKQERERAEARAAKAAKAAYFQQLANGVAKLHMAKEQDLTDKIDNEYKEQLRRAREDEENRKRMSRQRINETHRVLNRQCDEKKRQQEQERAEARRLAEALEEESRQAREQENMRRAAARSEAQRLKEFLGTQLQLMHFKETRPLETSITRPMSRAQSMFSPSRYNPSPKPDEMQGIH